MSRDSEEAQGGQRRNLVQLSQDEIKAQVRYEKDKALGYTFFAISVFVVIMVLIGGYIGA